MGFGSALIVPCKSAGSGGGGLNVATGVAFTTAPLIGGAIGAIDEGGGVKIRVGEPHPAKSDRGRKQRRRFTLRSLLHFVTNTVAGGNLDSFTSPTACNQRGSFS